MALALLAIPREESSRPRNSPLALRDYCDTSRRGFPCLSNYMKNPQCSRLERPERARAAALGHIHTLDLTQAVSGPLALALADR